MKNLGLLKSSIAFTLLLAACGQSADQNSSELTTQDVSPAFILIGSKATLLKKSTEDASKEEDESATCVLPAGKKISLQKDPAIVGAHFLVHTEGILPGCSFSKGYVYREHVKDSSVKILFSANVSAFLDTIGYAEGTGDRYDYMFTHKVFYSYAGHPRQIQCSRGLCSDAAGRYQFLSPTWDALRRKLGLTDFSPTSQDKAAVQLMKDVGCYNLVAKINGPETFSRAAYCVSGQWASFPGSPYGQPTKSVSNLYSNFSKFLLRY